MFNQLEKTFDINIEHLYQLANIANKITKQTRFQAYTDRSLTYTNNKAWMGFGWVLSTTDQEEYRFQDQTSLFPSSTKAEIMAILTVMTILPRDTHINICSDS